jgi:hypothetical protein
MRTRREEEVEEEARGGSGRTRARTQNYQKINMR